MYLNCQAAEAAAIEQNRVLLAQAVKQLAISCVEVRYSGGGDSGDVSEVETVPPCAAASLSMVQIEVQHATVTWDTDRKPTYTLAPKAMSVDDALRDFVLGWVSLNHPGWEINDGGSGTVTINLETDTFNLEHDAYYTESFHHEYSL